MQKRTRVLGAVVGAVVLAAVAVFFVVQGVTGGSDDGNRLSRLPDDPDDRAQVVLQRLKSASVPGMCEHQPGRLANGKLPGIPESDGFVSLAAAYVPNRARDTTTTGDLTGDGQADIAAAFMCSQGGVGWPNWVVLYDDQMEVVGTVDLGEIKSAEHSEVESLRVAGQQLTITWLSYEGADSCKMRFTADVRVRGGKATVSWPKQIGPTGAGC